MCAIVCPAESSHLKEPPMTAAPEHRRIWVELAVREQNGISVTLSWARGTELLAVTVVDDKNDDSFAFVLDPDERPLDVFYHPYAYATTRGRDFRSGVEDGETADV
jgi:hypothetical protein